MLTSDFPSNGAPEDLVELGRIVSAYGVRGWLKIQPHAANGQVLLNAKTWWVKTPAPLKGAGVLSSAQAVKVSASRMHSGTVVAQLASVPDREAAETLKGYTVSVPRSAFPAPDNDEYYWVDLVGCRLFGEDDNNISVLIGQVVGVIDNGAHAVLQVNRATQVTDDGPLQFLQDEKGRDIQVLVPFVSAHVHTVDLPNKTLHSNWPFDL